MKPDKHLHLYTNDPVSKKKSDVQTALLDHVRKSPWKSEHVRGSPWKPGSHMTWFAETAWRSWMLLGSQSNGPSKVALSRCWIPCSRGRGFQKKFADEMRKEITGYIKK